MIVAAVSSPLRPVLETGLAARGIAFISVSESATGTMTVMTCLVVPLKK